MSGIIIRKKQPKQPLDVNNSVQTTPPVQSSSGRLSPSYNSSSGYSDISGHHRSKSQSQDHSSQSSYGFQDNASSSTRYSVFSVRSSGVFSPSDNKRDSKNLSDTQRKPIPVDKKWIKEENSKSKAINKETSRPSDAEIEKLFVDLMDKRDLRNRSDAQRKQMLAIPVDKKWILIKNDLIQEESNSADEKNTPEYFLKRILDRTITVNHLNSLSVSIRTLPIKWIRSFIDSKGLNVLTNHLTSITRKPIKREVDLQMEYGIIKCLKSLLNYKLGAREALSHPTCIHNITFSLVSQQLNTRKLVADILSFFCYCEIPTGHNLVLEGFDQLMQFRGENDRFNAWMSIFENTIDSRGRFGSLVNASGEFKKAGIGIDGSLVEYTLANMMLVNSIIDVCDDIEVRVHLRNQLHACGLSRIIEKIKALNYELINRQISQFECESELDLADITEY